MSGNRVLDILLKKLTDHYYLKCSIADGEVLFYIDDRSSKYVKVMLKYRLPRSIILAYGEEPDIANGAEEVFNDPVFQMFGLVWNIPSKELWGAYDEL